ncbi:P-loop containing nucleoside triphosphate hydrolase protein [Ramicandelaber brevisporus]|nr:P-loop containing nucleoside triphosphate hydrolase protein [Ramicandelaber brevisporus]
MSIFAQLRSWFAAAATTPPTSPTKPAKLKKVRLSHVTIGNVTFDEDEIHEFGLNTDELNPPELERKKALMDRFRRRAEKLRKLKSKLAADARDSFDFDDEDDDYGNSIGGGTKDGKSKERAQAIKRRINRVTNHELKDESLAGIWRNRYELAAAWWDSLAAAPQIFKEVYAVVPVLLLVLTLFQVMNEVGFVLLSFKSRELVNVLAERVKSGDIANKDDTGNSNSKSDISFNVFMGSEIFSIIVHQLGVSMLSRITYRVERIFTNMANRRVQHALERRLLDKIRTFDLATYKKLDRFYRSAGGCSMGWESSGYLSMANEATKQTLGYIVSFMQVAGSFARLCSTTYLLCRVHYWLAGVVLLQMLANSILQRLFTQFEIRSPLIRSVENAKEAFHHEMFSMGNTYSDSFERHNAMLADITLARFDKTASALEYLEMKEIRKDLLVELALTGLSQSQSWPATIFTAYMVMQGLVPVGEMTEVFTTSREFEGSLSGVMRNVMQMIQLGATFDAFMALLEFEPVMVDSPDPVPLSKVLIPRPIAGNNNGNSNNKSIASGVEIEFRNVSFKYPGKQSGLVLRNVSFTIPAGQTVSIVGRNGTGKSTLIKLINRLYDPTEGQILFNGIDIRNISLADVRGLVSILDQKYEVIYGTFTQAIGFGRAHESIKMDVNKRLQLVKSAAQMSGFDKVLAKSIKSKKESMAENKAKAKAKYKALLESSAAADGSNSNSDNNCDDDYDEDGLNEIDYDGEYADGYRTFYGYYGGNNNTAFYFSGGERQKLAISKALFRAGPSVDSENDPLAALPTARIVVFDEPASALDAIAEAEMHRELHGLVKNCGSDAVADTDTNGGDSGGDSGGSGRSIQRSAIFISHRMASSRMADRIIVFGEEGKIVEDGTFTELMKMPLEGSVFRSMFETQANTFLH